MNFSIISLRPWLNKQGKKRKRLRKPPNKTNASVVVSGKREEDAG